MKRRVWIAGVLVAVACLAASARAAEKIAVVDLAKIMDAYAPTETAEDLLQKLFDEYEQEKEGLKKKLDALKEELVGLLEQAENKMLTDSAREKKVDAARKKQAELLEFQRDMRATLGDRQRELGERRARMNERIVGELKDKVSDYAKKHSIALVLDTASIGVAGAPMILHADDTLDITDKVMEALAEEEK